MIEMSIPDRLRRALRVSGATLSFDKDSDLWMIRAPNGAFATAGSLDVAIEFFEEMGLMGMSQEVAS